MPHHSPQSSIESLEKKLLFSIQFWLIFFLEKCIILCQIFISNNKETCLSITLNARIKVMLPMNRIDIEQRHNFFYIDLSLRARKLGNFWNSTTLLHCKIYKICLQVFIRMNNYRYLFKHWRLFHSDCQ